MEIWVPETPSIKEPEYKKHILHLYTLHPKCKDKKTFQTENTKCVC